MAKVELWLIGKTNFKYLDEGIAIYQKRLQHYLKFEMKVIPDIKNTKNLAQHQIKNKEGQKLLEKFNIEDFVILLDESGKSYSSLEFATFIEKKIQLSYKKIVFVIGGAYGFDEAVYKRANGKLSLSNMTFSHQMIRLLFVEQLYRAMTILNNEPYHHR